MPTVCPHCQAAINDQGEDDDDNPFVHAPVGVMVTSTPTLRTKPVRVPGEPWYYSTISIGARLTALLGFLVFVVALAFAFSPQCPEPLVIGFGGLIVMCVAWGAAAPSLLALDTARNVRAIRYRR